MENDSMTPLNQSIVDIPDFMNKPQETRAVLTTEAVLQEYMRHEYCKVFIAGLMCGFLTGILVMLILGEVLMTHGII